MKNFQCEHTGDFYFSGFFKQIFLLMLQRVFHTSFWWWWAWLGLQTLILKTSGNVRDVRGFREHGQIIFSLAANFRFSVAVISMNQSSAQEGSLYYFMSSSKRLRDTQDEFHWWWWTFRFCQRCLFKLSSPHLKPLKANPQSMPIPKTHTLKDPFFSGFSGILLKYLYYWKEEVKILWWKLMPRGVYLA